MQKQDPRVFVVMSDTILGIPLNDTVGYSSEDTEDGNDVLLPIKCKKCGLISIEYATLDFVSVDNERQMGPDLMYSAYVESIKCSCGNKINVTVDISTYAASWGIDDYSFEGCELVFIEGLEATLDQYYGKESQSSRNVADLLEQRQYLEQEIKELRQLSAKHILLQYVIVVEGLDDVEIWIGLLQNRCIDPFSSRIHIISGARKGGRSEAIATFDTIKRLPIMCKKKLIVDSDNKKEAIEKDMVAANFVKSDYHILSVKELEVYLLNAKAISLVVGLPEETIQETMTKIPRRGKEQLEILFKSLQLGKITAQTKLLIARRLPVIPLEIEDIINEIKKETGHDTGIPSTPVT